MPDLKEGYYFGRELPADPRPMHGPNIWPAEPASLRPLVTEWMAAMEPLGQRVLSLMAEGLGLAPDCFRNDLTADPTPLFRIFRYPPHPPDGSRSVGRRRAQRLRPADAAGPRRHAGLEVKVGDEWIDAPSDPQLIICNLGDMLDRLTAGRYRRTPHRARNRRPPTATRCRSSSIRLGRGGRAAADLDARRWLGCAVDADRRWDRANLRDLDGTYGDWLIAKVSKVFPHLADAVIDDRIRTSAGEGVGAGGAVDVGRDPAVGEQRQQCVAQRDAGVQRAPGSPRRSRRR